MPALLVALPVVLSAFAWFPALRGLGPALLTLLGLCGVMVWLAQLARDRGSRLQPTLYAAWGGQPSVAALRHRDTLLPAELKARYHAFLSKAVSGLTLPTAEEEARDPKAADRLYEAGCAWLLAQTRDTKRFALLFEENVNYGFRRNFWAMKPLALTASMVTLAASAAVIGWSWFSIGTEPSAETAAAAVLIAVYVGFVLVRVQRDWVRIPAIGYARQLLAACDMLSVPKPPTRGNSRRKREARYSNRHLNRGQRRIFPPALLSTAQIRCCTRGTPS